jgi:Rad3-related DNA helicase
LVIATATVALQEQIVYKDLPDLMRNSGLNFSFALAKGRGRYMCLSKLDMLLQEGHAQTATAQLFEEEGFKIEVDEASQKLFTSMIEKLAGNKWDHRSQPVHQPSLPELRPVRLLQGPRRHGQGRRDRHQPRHGSG